MKVTASKLMTPPPSGAELLKMVELVTVAVPSTLLLMPPPLPSGAELLEMVQLVTESVP